MTPTTYNVLFLCTGNSARSVMAEALLNVLGKGRFHAMSAGSHPTGTIQPLAARLCADLGYDVSRLRSKSWGEFVGPDAAPLHFVITVCDNAAGEICPVWPGSPVFAHWGVADPAHHPNDPQAFLDAWSVLRRRIELMLSLPLDSLDRLAAEQQLRDIAHQA